MIDFYNIKMVAPLFMLPRKDFSVIFYLVKQV